MTSPDSAQNSHSGRNDRITNYKDFWPFYLTEHRDVTSRRFHYAGTALSIAALVGAFVITPWLALAAPLLGYGHAWAGHFFFEKNKPATFKYPLWSLASDYRMFFLWITGRLDPELKKAGAA